MIIPNMKKINFVENSCVDNGNFVIMLSCF